MKEQVTAKIRKLRVEKGISQEKVADELGITHSSYSKIERGETDPNLSRLFELAKIFGVAVTDFFEQEPLSMVREPRASYTTNSITKSDIDSLNQSIQVLLGEISSLRTQLTKQGSKGTK